MESFKTKCLIVGAGLFGSVTAKFLRSRGIESIIVDRRDPLAASKCSSGIWRPGWAGKIERETALSLPILEKFTAICKLPIFDVDKEKDTEIDFIDCNQLLDEEFLEGDVIRSTFHDKNKKQLRSLIVNVEDVEIEIECEFAVIAAGAFTNSLLQKLNIPIFFGLDSQWGAVIHSSDKLEKNYIQNWAPYKQLYGLSLIRGGREISYFTMGSSAKNPPAGGDQRTLNIGEKLVQYAVATGKLRKIVEIPEGLRPFFSISKGEDKHIDFVNRHCANVFSATGGAKNSTLLSGYVAKRIFEEITDSSS